MRAAAIAALIVAAVVGTAAAAKGLGGNGLASGSGLSSGAGLTTGSRYKSIEVGITAADQSGSWWALKADGTMLASSALTMTGAGSPGVSPLSFNGVDQKYTSGTVAYPAGSFSIVMVFKVDPSASGGVEVLSKWEGATLSYTLELSSSVSPKFYVVSLGGTTGRADGSDIAKGAWVCMAGMYTTGTGGVILRQFGIGNAAATATGGGVAAQTVAHRVGAYSGGAFFWGQSRGAFFTEKVLSDADVDRICAGAL